MFRRTNCEYCDGTITKVKAVFPLESKALGTVSVPDIEQHKCSKCGNTTLLLDEANKVSQYVRDKEQHVINSLPVSDFISINQAAELLGISKQAFSKHPRIKRGFIYSITIDNKKFFYKRSVEAFRETKDGRVEIDGCVLLQFISDTPAIAFENFRTIMNRDNAIQLVDNLAKSLNHYPTPGTPTLDATSFAKKTKARREKS